MAINTPCLNPSSPSNTTAKEDQNPQKEKKIYKMKRKQVIAYLLFALLLLASQRHYLVTTFAIPVLESGK